MKYLNQFLITKKSFSKFPDWTTENLGEYQFYVSPELSCETEETPDCKLIVIGEIYDYQNPDYSNKDIVQKLAQSAKSLNELQESLLKYSGVYLVFYKHFKTNKIAIVNDTAAQRELYYLFDSSNDLYASSSPSLIASVYPLKQNTTKECTEFFESKKFKVRNSFVVNETNFEHLYRLKPNHYIDVTAAKALRFFPHEKNKYSYTPKEAAAKVANMIKGYLTAASNRSKLLVPVSAGWDSRLILAASKDICSNIDFFVTTSKTVSLDHFDIKTPKKLFEKLNIPFNIVEPTGKLSSKLSLAELREIVPFFREDVLLRYEHFYKKYANSHILINGNVSEIARLEFDEIYNLTPKKIAFIQKYPFLKYVLSHYNNWYKINKNLFEENEYRILDMLYWEENCANWVAKTKSEFRALNVNVFSPFNSRELLLTLLSIDKKYRRKQNPIVYKKMISELWPELLEVPVNPGRKKMAMRITQGVRIFPLLRNLKLSILLFLGRNKW